MLRSLHIENIAVIRCVDIDFDIGFSALTGETGAGKSIVIDSINLLLGNRSSRAVIRSGAEHATVSALFEELSPSIIQTLSDMGFSCEDRSLMLQRTIGADGRSQTRLNGQSITQGMQKEIARLLVSIHGQSDNQKLLQKSTHGELVDAYAHLEQELAAYKAVWKKLWETQKLIDDIQVDESEKLRLREILQFQISDIEGVNPKIGEEEALSRELERLANIEKINRQAELVYRALKGGDKGSAMLLISRAQNAMMSIGGTIDGADALVERLAAVSSELEDIAETAIGFTDDDREDPTDRIDRIEGRLDAIFKLKRKYGGSVEAVLAFRDSVAEKLDSLNSSEERLESLQKTLKALNQEAVKLAAVLSEKRKAAAKKITEQVIDALAFLDMPKVIFDIQISSAPLNANGADDIEFLIATNVGEPLLPMVRIASGGELSRIMLALRSVLNDQNGAETVIFDEVDTGVSGKTARKIGMKLRQTASHTAQVVCVTHSAQIASLADSHFLITKGERDGRAETDVRKLDEASRIEEIARILGGIHITDAQRAAAKEMMTEDR